MPSTRAAPADVHYGDGNSLVTLPDASTLSRASSALTVHCNTVPLDFGQGANMRNVPAVIFSDPL